MKPSLRTFAAITIAVMSCLAIAMPQAQGAVSFGPNMHFGYGTGVYLSFTEPAIAASIVRINGYWTFSELTFKGTTTSMTWMNSGSNVLIDSFDPNGEIKYSVDGNGTQTFSVARNPTTVYIDGVQALSGWTFSSDNFTMTVSSATSTVALDFTPASVSTSYFVSIITSSYAVLVYIILALILISIAFIRVRRLKIAISHFGRLLKENKWLRTLVIIVLSLLLSSILTLSFQYVEGLQVESFTPSGIFTMANETQLSQPVQITTNGPGIFESVGRAYAYFSSPYASAFNNFSVWMSVDDSPWTKVPLLPFETENRTLMGDLGLVNLDNFRINVNVKYFFPPQTIYSENDVSLAAIEGSFNGHIQIIRKATIRDTATWMTWFFIFFSSILTVVFYIIPFERHRRSGSVRRRATLALISLLLWSRRWSRRNYNRGRKQSKFASCT